jgi:large subunit ribosomal protein L13
MTTTQTKGNQVNRQWHLVDLKDQTLGRVCTAIAQILIGKDNPSFSYHRDDGGYVVAINASQIKVTGKKANDKVYYHHTGYPGGIKEATFKELMVKDPRQIIINGVYGMLPKNKLRDLRIRRLKVFIDSNHPYSEKIK